MKDKYLPLLVLLSVGALNEGVSFISLHINGFNSINGNIYVFLDFILTVWLFQKLDSGLSGKFLLTILFIGTATWVSDNLLLHSLYSNNSLFRMVAAFLIFFLSIDKINQLIFSDSMVVTSKTDLLLSSGFLGYYAYKAFVEAFHLVPMHLDKSFYIILWVILGIINLIVNLLITIAILCIQQKKVSSIPLLRA